MATKFGLDEIGKPAPQWMERLWTALTMFVFPAMAAFVLALTPNVISEHTANIMGACGTFFMGLFKGLKFLFSDENQPGNGT